METMKPTTPKPTTPVTKADPIEELAVFELRFCVRDGRDIGIDDTNGTGRGLLRAKKDLIDITYLPRRRLFRVTEHRRHDRPGPKTVYIPESWAMFELMPE